jgi:hypothetical protein
MAEKEVFDFNQMKVPNISPKFIKYGVIGILALIFIFSSFFTISPEVNVSLRKSSDFVPNLLASGLVTRRLIFLMNH